MPSASNYTNKMRVSAAARNVKVQYPGNIGNLTQSLLPITCNIPNSRWDSIEYKEVCFLSPKFIPKPPPPSSCATTEYFYDSGGPDAVNDPCSIMNGDGINTEGAILLDAGREC
jgi:hypothetical protein